MNLPKPSESSNKTSAFTLVETMMALVVAGVIFGGVLMAYIHSARFSEWTGYSMAAQALSLQQLEQTRAAKWDTQAVPEAYEITNSFFSTSGIPLDVPRNGTNILYATNFISIGDVTAAPGSGVRLKMLRVDTVWSYREKLFTNTTATYVAPDR